MACTPDGATMTKSLVLSAILLTPFTLAGCSTAPKSEAARTVQSVDVDAFITRIKAEDPSMKKFFGGCEAFAAFPDIGKGGFIFGGAYGKGQLRTASGKLIGYCDVSQGSVGAQIGGQSFGEIIFFQTKEAMQEFKGGQFALAAQASAVAVKAGAGASVDYQGGVAVFIVNPVGLMLEASVGGQQFNYHAASDFD